jgi:endonuclease/exonuclease/phosphatase family metal-dependent hydrolase
MERGKRDRKHARQPEGPTGRREEQRQGLPECSYDWHSDPGNLGVVKVRIVTWNLRNGAGEAVWPHLQAELQADIVLLQEATAAPEDHKSMWAKVPDSRWGSAIVTTLGAMQPIPIPGYEGWLVGAEIDSNFGPLAVFSVHAPSSTKACQRRPYTDEVVTMLGLIREAIRPNVPLVIGGDFNFTLGERHASEAMKTTAADRQALAAIRDAGLVSCWTAANPNQPLLQTLRWSSDKAPGKTTPYHCDGILVPKAWSGWVQCEIHTAAPYMVSDHNPVSAALNLPAI